MSAILNVNPGERDRLHRPAGLTERCNTDQIAPNDRRLISDEDAANRVTLGTAEWCKHCGDEVAV